MADEHVKRTFYAQHCTVGGGPSGSTMSSPLFHKRYDFRKDLLETNCLFSFLYNVCLKYFSFKEELSEIL